MTTIQSWYDFVLQQMAAEAYFEGITSYVPELVRPQLIKGNNRDGFDPAGNTRFTDSQADDFLNRFQIINQLSDNPNDPEQDGFFDNTGLSATLIQKKDENG